jgi:hypothetical protein
MMERWQRWLAASLFALPGLATAAASGPLATGDAEHAAHDAAFEQYRVDVLAQLQSSRQPRELLVAARLLRWGGERAPAADAAARDRLVQRALRLGDADPVAWWVAATDCPASAAICDAPRARARLRQLAPSNAAVWMLREEGERSAAHSAPTPTRVAQDDRRLARIAAASRYDSYMDERFAMYHAALARVPLPAALDPDQFGLGPAPGDSAVRASIAIGIMLAESMPDVGSLSAWCGEQGRDAGGPARAGLCRAALQRVVEEADSLLVQRLALGLLARSTSDPAELGRIARARNVSEWQMQAFGELTNPSAGETFEPAAFERYVERWLVPGTTELDALRAALQSQDVPLTPPPGWKPWSWLQGRAEPAAGEG